MRPRPTVLGPILPALLVLATLGCTARRSIAGHPRLEGPETATLPFYKPTADARRIFVEADLGDGVPRMFLVDTGSPLTAISAQLAEELNLPVTRGRGRLYGLSGSVPWDQAQVPDLKVGPYHLEKHPVAVGVQGLPTSLGAVPIAGLIGNDFWGNFQVVVDYPTGNITLAAPETLTLPEDSAHLIFDGQHISTGVAVRVERDGRSMEQQLLLEIDTGAGGLLIFGASGGGLEDLATVGEEPIFGIGPLDELPTSNFLRETRRLQVRSMTAGGRQEEVELQATWYPGSAYSGPDGGSMSGLLGHAALEDHRVWLDYPGGRFAMEAATPPAPGTARSYHDLEERTLQVMRRSDRKGTRLQQAGLLASMERLDEAGRLIEAELKDNPDNAEARAWLARLQRYEGEVDRGLTTLRVLNPAQLVEQGAIVELVTGLWLGGEVEAAMAMAERATQELPEESATWVALSDMRRITGEFAAARRAIREANRLDENPDGHLLRRALIADAEGDVFGTITHLRRIMDLYPHSGLPPWYYAREVAGTEHVEQLERDLERSLARLHPEDRPFDFLAAAYAEVGKLDLARELVELGRARDCPLATIEESTWNCEAWYRAMGRFELPEATRLARQAVARQPARTEFLDTLATVLDAAGQVKEAREAAWTAARIDPTDVYLVWQAARLDAAAGGGS